MKKKKDKGKLTCPHCFHTFPASQHIAFQKSYFYGDGDGKDDSQHYHRYYFEPCISDTCPKCGEDVYVRMWIPEMVEGEPCTTFDIDTFLDTHEIVLSKEYQKLLYDYSYFEDEKGKLLINIVKSKNVQEARAKVKPKYKAFAKYIFENSRKKPEEDLPLPTAILLPKQPTKKPSQELKQIVDTELKEINNNESKPWWKFW